MTPALSRMIECGRNSPRKLMRLECTARPDSPGISVAAHACMLLVLVVAASVWVSLMLAICAICAVGGAADEQSEEWYCERQRAAEDEHQRERGAA